MSKSKPNEGAQFVRYFGPLLDALRELGGSGTPDEVVARIAEDLSVSDEIQDEVTPSGVPRFRNQIAWARLYLVHEALLDSSKRGVWSLTPQGRATHLSMDDSVALYRKLGKVFQEMRRAKSKTTDAEEPVAVEGNGEAPTGYRGLLLERLHKLPPGGFERLCKRILRESGFNEVVVTGSSGDGGIDGYGTLAVNPLVSFKVLFQCKRYSKSVSPSHVRDFRGAMAGRADKGIVITTGTFTTEARREATRDGVPPIELIDGEKLVDMLEQLELGLRPVKAYEVDPEFFREFES